MANEVRIRVLVVSDDSLRSALKPLEESVGSAQKKVKTGLDGIERDTKASTRRRLSEEERAVKEAAKRRDKEQKDEEKALDRKFKALERKVAAERKLLDQAEADKKKRAEQTERYLSQVRNNSLRAEQSIRQRDSSERAAFTRRMVSDFGSRAVSNIQRTLGAGARFGQQIATGAGYETSFQGSMARNIELQRRSIDLSNQGYIPSEGKERIDPKEVEQRIKDAADATRTDRLAAASGLSAFVGKSGELEMGLKMLPELGKLARASGSDLNDLADAAGDVSNAFKDKSPQERMEKTQAVMRALAGQGKIGAVEIKNLASQAAKLASAAGAFGGDAEKNLGFMGALTQMSRATGGSASATQAATSIPAFVNTLNTPARIKHFEKAYEGRSVSLRDEKTGLMNDPEMIVMQALNKARGNSTVWKQMFANVQGARAVEGARQTYMKARASSISGGASEADANEVGLKAVRGEFDRFKKISMSGGEIDESFNRSMNAQDAKSQAFNAKFDDIVEKMGEKLLPALEKLEPVVLKAAEAFTQLVTWAAENPGKAITAAIVGSIAKAGLETALRAGLESALSKAIGGGIGGAGAKGGPGGGGMGALGTGLVIFGAAVTISGAGIEIIDSHFDSKDKADSGVEGALNKAESARVSAAVGAPSIEKLNSMIAEREALRAQSAASVQGSEIKNNSMTWNALSGAANFVSMGEYGTSFGAQYAAGAASDKDADIQAGIDRLNASITKMTGQLTSGIPVTVSNMPQIGALLGTMVDQAGRGTGIASGE